MMDWINLILKGPYIVLILVNLDTTMLLATFLPNKNLCSSYVFVLNEQICYNENNIIEIYTF